MQESRVFLLCCLFWQIIPSAAHVCSRFWEKPPPSDCFMTKCVFSHMCPSSHVLSPLLGELTQTRMHTQVRTKTHRRAYACWPMHAFSLSVTHRWIPWRPGGGSGWDRDEHMLGSEQPCVIHISLSLFLSISCFLLSLIIDTSLPPLCALFTPLCLWKAECFKCILHTNSSDDCSWTYRGN